MTRVAFLCSCVLLAVSSSASGQGLQSALNTAITNLQPSSVISIPLGQPPLPLSNSFQAARDQVEGSLFIDPITSTLGRGVFGPGPRFIYNRMTGGLAIDAPPLLGPADEFGLRQEYSPRTITVVARDNLAAVSVPEITLLTRNEPPLLFDLTNPPEPLTSESLAFVPTPGALSTVTFSSLDSGNVTVSGGARLFRSSSELDSRSIVFDRILAPGLDTSIFAVAEELLTADGIGVVPSPLSLTLLNDTPFALLPEVYVDVTYSLVNGPLGITRIPRQFSLLALPNSVPEPNAIAFALLGLAAASLSRRFAPRVA